MKKYMFLHFGFEKPTPEIMAAWGKWFESVADKTVENGGFHGGAREISHSGTKDLPMGMESITGYSIINANILKFRPPMVFSKENANYMLDILGETLANP